MLTSAIFSSKARLRFVATSAVKMPSKATSP